MGSKITCTISVRPFTQMYLIFGHEKYWYQYFQYFSAPHNKHLITCNCYLLTSSNNDSKLTLLLSRNVQKIGSIYTVITFSKWKYAILSHNIIYIIYSHVKLELHKAKILAVKHVMSKINILYDCTVHKLSLFRIITLHHHISSHRLTQAQHRLPPVAPQHRLNIMSLPVLINHKDWLYSQTIKLHNRSTWHIRPQNSAKSGKLRIIVLMIELNSDLDRRYSPTKTI